MPSTEKEIEPMYGIWDCDDYTPSYRSAIVDECGDLVAWVSDLEREGFDIDSYLYDHPEYRITCICD